nr:amino acid adenylation domain-containing protein [Candidatus Aminicenantes bacterium]NIM78476.1 amino acid adenylation domain-containing protein [Candidatus Aminicenantes bacterium]NIN17737.1 amino acid adenylation domain-containing protein [Candidatus Aminicenantes bacterium]NIN41613.1 amino acid adenylation domain-containing protein [Candidatus Aminicenantes bacterium]NIN84387.1 amino acid adenylation domain-containing protein [Candidatus Aminicenantes bacterium]
MEKQTISIDTFTAAAQYVKERDYWMQKLSGGLIKSYFPYDNTKGKTSHLLTCQNDPVSIRFSGEVFLKLMKLSGGHDYTLHMIAAAVVVVLLDKYANNDNKDIIVGVPIYKQDIDSDTEFINSVLALRIQFQENITFKELLFQVRQTMLKANKNKNFPINVLVSMLKMSGRENDFPLFDVAVMLENIHDTSYLRPVNINMVFCLRRAEESVELGVQYNTSRYERVTVQRIASHFNRVLQQVLFNVDMPLPDIEITTEEEKRQLLKDFNDTAAEYPHDKTIHELFNQQVARTPGHTAATGRGQGAGGRVCHLSYGELNKRSNQLAHVLRKKGVKPDAIVGLMVKRSVEMVIGLLAILKAGGAYLPIDPNYPQERKRYMLADCNAGILLSEVSEVSKVSGETEVIDLPSLIVENDDAEPTHLTHLTHPTHLCYVIYTSGSTGRPKGVLVEQQNVVRLVKNTNYIEFRQNDRILQTGALAFDASTFEIWGALLNGITLCLVPEEDILDPEMLKQDIGKYYISTMWLTSSLFNYLCGEDTGIFAGLKNLLVGGDVLSPLHINRVRERFPGLNILNGYGPTENTTFSTTYLITKNYEERIPIGKPIANSTAYILDRCDNLVPVGVVGELYVGGKGVSRGYLNNPELTAEKFILAHSSWLIADRGKKNVNISGDLPMSYELSAMSCLYKTGDLARWLPDGNIEFWGRMDFQVKIRGFRIEPGEIENRLLDHPLVKEAVVLVREEGSGDKYLCAYIVTHQALAVSQLREYLSEDFPDYMIPSYFVLLEKMPLTPNGKVDRAALPIPEVGPDAQPVYTAPGDQVEQTLVKIWSEILNLASENLGIDANFFEVGGHSLKATIMIAQLHQELNVKIPLTQVFLTPTIRELAQYIKGVTRKEFTAIAGAENKNYYALSSAQKRLFVLQQLDKKAVGYNIPMAVALEGELDKQRLEKTFRGLIRRHESLRTSFEMIQKEPVQRIHNDVEFEIEYHTLDQDIDFVRSFDLSRPPLLRVGLIEEEEKKYILVLDMHHIVSDGTSMGTLVNDFMAFYSGQELSKLRIQYKDFSEWQNQVFLSPAMMKQETYWLEQFENEIPVLSLPTDYPRPGVLSFEGASAADTLENKTLEALRQLALKAEATLFMVLAALYNILLSRISTQEDILIGTPIAGRNHADLQEVMGMFVNTLVLRNYPRGNKTFIQFLEEIKSRVLGALENQDYPFEKLVEQLSDQLERDSGRNPIFDTMFTLQTVEIPEMRIPGLELKPYAFENKITKFDMSFTASEVGEGLLLNIDYSIKLFKNETVQRFLRYFKTIALSVIENPQQRIGEIQFLAGEEKQQLLLDFNDTYAPYPREKTVCQLFAEQVQERPDHIILVGVSSLVGTGSKIKEEVYVTYKELNEKAVQLAHCLRGKGVKPGSIVAIMAAPSVEMVIGLMGILKAGGAFLPIDTTYPQERIDY